MILSKARAREQTLRQEGPPSPVLVLDQLAHTVCLPRGSRYAHDAHHRWRSALRLPQLVAANRVVFRLCPSADCFADKDCIPATTSSSSDGAPVVFHPWISRTRYRSEALMGASRWVGVIWVSVRIGVQWEAIEGRRGHCIDGFRHALVEGTQSPFAPIQLFRTPSI